MNTNPTVSREITVNVALRGARVTSSFRDSLFDAANRSGMTPNEFVLQAAAEKLKATGSNFSGLFAPGDLKTMECR
ncbi:hypothetical protein D3C87_1962560 [compost metagenome]